MANIITISREFGSGGRELGKRLADLLEYEFFDKQIISEIAKKYTLDDEYVEKALNVDIKKSIPLTYGRTIQNVKNCDLNKVSILVDEKEVLEQIALLNKNCVIVGSNADVILNKYNVFSIFVCADLESKCQRCLQRINSEEKKTIKSIENEIKNIDRIRSKTREILTEGKWGDKSQYNLIVNTTGWDLSDLAIALTKIVESWFIKNGD